MEGIDPFKNIMIQSNYFDDCENKKENTLEKRIKELEEKNNKLEQENLKLQSKITELFRMLNGLLKINTDSSSIDFQQNFEEIKKKLTSIFYRELRLKHVLPFSSYLSMYGTK